MQCVTVPNGHERIGINLYFRDWFVSLNGFLDPKERLCVGIEDPSDVLCKHYTGTLSIGDLNEARPSLRETWLRPLLALNHYIAVIARHYPFCL